MGPAGKVVILDSDLCVLDGIIALKNIGIYVGTLIEWQQYWPKYVLGNKIDTRFGLNDVGETDSFKGELDGIPHNIFCTK